MGHTAPTGAAAFPENMKGGFKASDIGGLGRPKVSHRREGV